MNQSKSRLSAWGTLACAAAVSLACSREGAAPSSEQAEVVSDAPVADQLPKLELRDETPELLLTWVDEQGDFHVVTKPADVPPEGRAQVRAVVTTSEHGAGRLVYVADLRSKAADGTYPVGTMTRAQWNEIGAERRKVRMDAVARQAPPEPKAAEPQAAGKITPEEKRQNAKVRAVVYGADWCKPCHEAEDFLKALGVNVTKKDIEESRAARAEMNDKLMQAGQMGASIPVLDVGGKILIGFNPASVSQAVLAARKPETL